jgi:hypothetical protein
MAFDSFNPAESLIPNDGDLVFDATTGEGGRSPSETVLPYIEQRADPDTIYRDTGVVTTPDHADFTLGSPEENDGSSQGFVINWSTSGPGDELTAGFCATGQTSADGSSQGNTWAGHTAGEGSSQGIIIDWSGPGDKLTAGFCATGQPSADGSDLNAFPTETIKMTYGAIEDGRGHDAFPTETVFPTETIHPYEESIHNLYDLVM